MFQKILFYSIFIFQIAAPSFAFAEAWDIQFDSSLPLYKKSLVEVNIKISQCPYTLPDLTNDEKVAVYFYTTNFYKTINDLLRNKVDVSNSKLIMSLDSALEKLPKYIGTVYRLTNLPAKALDQYDNDNSNDELTYFSTTHDTSYVDNMLKSGWPAAHGFVINSKTGAKIECLSNHPEEKEVLMPRGTQFNILNIQRNVNFRNLKKLEALIQLNEI